MDELNPKRNLSPEEQKKLNKLLHGFEKTDVKRLANTPEDLAYMIRLWDKYQELEDYSGHMKRFKPGTMLSIENYPRHRIFFDSTKDYRESLFMAGNRVGKSDAGSYCASCWSTGVYPDWWKGRVFTTETLGWVCADRNDSLKASVIPSLLGENGVIGTGMLPMSVGNAPGIINITTKPGTGGVFDSVVIRTDMSKRKPSIINTRTYEQGMRAFMGQKCHWVWEDEEGELDVHSECGTRTMTYGGIVIVTFTPLEGLTRLVMEFKETADNLTVGLDQDNWKDYKYLVPEKKSVRALIQAGWKHAPHLTPKMIEDERAKTPPHLKDARENGNPTMGSGNVYPVPRAMIEIPSVKVSPEWKQVIGLDVGGNTWAGFFAWDLSRDVVYLYDEYFGENQAPAVIASALKHKMRGKGIPVMIDPASRQRSQTDGNRLITIYRKEGLDVRAAMNGVEAGVTAVWDRLSTGRLMVASHCHRWFKEYEIYKRDIDGKIVKKFDHAMDGTKYAILSLAHSKVANSKDEIINFKYKNEFKF